MARIKAFENWVWKKWSEQNGLIELAMNKLKSEYMKTEYFWIIIKRNGCWKEEKEYNNYFWNTVGEGDEDGWWQKEWRI